MPDRRQQLADLRQKVEHRLQRVEQDVAAGDMPGARLNCALAECALQEIDDLLQPLPDGPR